MKAPALFWIPLLPLLGAAFNLIVGRKLSRRWVYTVGVGSVVASFVWVLFVLRYLYGHWDAHAGTAGVIQQTVFDWINAGSVQIKFGLLADTLTGVMLLTVTFVGSLIHLYSTGYMAHEKDYARFFGYLNLFTAAMLVLVLGDNLVVLFVGWEGVGLCSYLLIGFWYDKSGTSQLGIANSNAGRKAFIVNRVGDLAFIIGMFVLFAAVGSLSFDQLKSAAELGLLSKLLQVAVPLKTIGWILAALGLLGAAVAFVKNKDTWVVALSLIAVLLGGLALFLGYGGKVLGPYTIAGVAALFLFIGATGKSAQIPLFIWLPDAMAGPTPVSALIHAATMVTAGVYMVARLNFIYMLTPTVMGVVALVGGVTALFAATIGFAQNDIKKVLAYSTVSQLGYMFIGVGVGAFAAGIFHVFTHAFFKACLFLGSGAVIHALHEEQDIRQMGGLSSKLRVTRLTFLVSTLAIAGIVPFAGFFSKDEILWKALTTTNPAWPSWFSALIWALGLLGAICTAFYMFRLYSLTFAGSYRGQLPEHKIHEAPWTMASPLVVLAAGAAVLGFLGLPGFAGAHSNFFHNWLAPTVDEGARIAGRLALAGGWVQPGHLAHNHAMEIALAALSVLIAAGSSYWAYRWYRFGPSPAAAALVAKIGPLYRVVSDKYRIDEVYGAVVVWPFRKLALLLWRVVDFLLIDQLGVNLIGARLWQFFGRIPQRLQNGSVQHYLVGLVAGLAVIVVWISRPPAEFAVRAASAGNRPMRTAGIKVALDERVVFDARREVVADGRRLEYRWDFDGDGRWDFPVAAGEKAAFSPRPTASFQFKKAGTFSVVLEVRDTRWRTLRRISRKLEVANLSGTPAAQGHKGVR